MSDPLSSSDGTDNNDKSGIRREFDTLEERIFNTGRPDEESDESFVMEPWMENQASILVNEINTSKVEVYTRALYQGLQKVRDVYEDVNDIERLMSIFRQLLGDNEHDQRLMSTLRSDLDMITNDIETAPEGMTFKKSPTWVPVKRSIVSEINRKFVDDLKMTKTQVYRVLMAFGFLDCENITRETEIYSEQMVDSFYSSVYDVREDVEASILQYVKSNFYDWNNKGIDEENKERLNEIIRLMETDRKEEIVEVCDDLGVL